MNGGNGLQLPDDFPTDLHARSSTVKTRMQRRLSDKEVRLTVELIEPSGSQGRLEAMLDAAVTFAQALSRASGAEADSAVT